jgi:cell wall-associated NlpC family hydrolase
MRKPAIAAIAAGLAPALLAGVILAGGELRTGITELCNLAGDLTATEKWSGEQLSNAATIVAVGRGRGLPERAWTIALATALQESGLRNIPYGDRDSLGLFQQRPSAGWGSPSQLLDPVYAAGKFYDGLVKTPGWETLPLTVAAQAVQRSAFPTAYARWETAARALVAATAGVVCTATQLVGLPGGLGGQIVAAALSQLGVPYSWGGGGPAGPSRGVAQGANIVGFDCSSLVQHAYAKVGIDMPRTTEAQINTGRRIPLAQLAAGDLIFFHMDTAVGHVGIYDGRGGMIHAPRTGRSVEIVPDLLSQPYWRDGFTAAVRPGT